MAKLNIFISQPMHGLNEREILAERDRIEEVLHKLFPNDELEFLSGYNDDPPAMRDPHRERIYHLGKSISLIPLADYAFFPYHYGTARGCEIERRVCITYYIPSIVEREIMYKRSQTEAKYCYSIEHFGGEIE